jgi:hypothetical protein
VSLATDLATVLDVALLGAFVWALVSLRELPTGRRPDVPVYTRSGKLQRVGPLDPPDEEPPPDGRPLPPDDEERAPARQTRGA